MNLNYVRVSLIVLTVVMGVSVVVCRRGLDWMYSRNSGFEIVDERRRLAVITYIHNGKPRKILVRLHRGPSRVSQVLAGGSDEGDEIDVTKAVTPLLTTNDNFATVGVDVVTPTKLGHNSLTFVMIDGTTQTFAGEEPIKFSVAQ